MGVNVFVLVRVEPDISSDEAFHSCEVIESNPEEAAEDIENIVNSVNEQFGGDGHNTFFDWCDVFKGPDAKALLNRKEALALPDEAGPWFVIEGLPPDGGLHLSVTNDGTTSLRQLWAPMIEEKHYHYKFLFLKARG